MVTWWRNLSVTKKLYAVVGLMAILIATELFTLFFAMNTLSSVRAFIAGEGLWTKAQKNAILSLYQYALEGDETYYHNFKQQLEVTEGDRKARLELEKSKYDYAIVRQEFINGGNHPGDVNGMIGMLVRYHFISYVGDAIVAWKKADQLLAELQTVAAGLHLSIKNEGKDSPGVKLALSRVALINADLTEQETAFSASLGAGSRWLERVLMIVLALAVFTIESTGILLTCRFSRNLNRSLKDLIRTAEAVGKGDFTKLAPVRSKDELGQLAGALNKMVQELKVSLANNEQADETLRRTKEQFRLQQRLRSSESKLHQVIEAAPNGLLMVDQNGEIVLCNAQIENLFGYRREDLLGKNFMRLLPKSSHRPLPDFLDGKLEEPEGLPIGTGHEIVGRRRDGSEVPIEIGFNPVATDEGHFVLASVVDITERTKIANELLVAKAAAEAANSAKSAFLANMSHEIRTPLGAVLGFAELVVDPQIPPSEKANFVAAIKRNGELLSNIINDILDLSKIEAGKMQIVPQDVTLTEVLTDTKTLLELQAKEKGVVLKVTVEENVPKVIRTDSLRLRQILINIVGNAVKFTNKGSVDVRIQMENTEKGSCLAFIVKDTGRGISDDQIDKLFSPFSQADITSKRKYGGTGLGLILSKRFADLLGGDVILLQTTVDKGSSFKITIDPGPVQVPQRVRDQEVKAPAVRSERPPLFGVRVLLAEDSPDNQILVSRILSVAGATVDIVSNGREAIEQTRITNYDVLLMDLQMPEMDGYEATAELRNEGYLGKIIALTAHTLNDDRERCINGGFDDHIGKPVNRNILIERVDALAKATPLQDPQDPPLSPML